MGCSASVVLPTIDQKYEQIRFLQRAMRNIDKYFHHLEKNLRIQLSPEEIVHQRDGVEKVVRQILHLVSILDPRFAVKDLLKIGSFYEGHKLVTADQYDFAVVLKALKEPQILIEDLNQPLNGLNVKVFVPHDRKDDFTEQWKDAVHESYLLGLKKGKFGQEGLLNLFLKNVRKTAAFCKPIETQFGTITMGARSEISIEGSSVKVPLKLTKTWHSVREMKRIENLSTEDISVNMTPAIKWNNVKDFIFPHDSIDPEIYESVVRVGYFLVIPCHNGHFRKIFAESEVMLMKSLPERHQRAFRIIKYIINGYKRSEYNGDFQSFQFKLFDTFTLKMMMLANQRSCPCFSYTDFELFDCVNHILQEILRSLFEEKDRLVTIYPHIFITNATVKREFNGSVRVYRSVMLDWMKHDLKFWIGDRERYDFTTANKHFGLTPVTVRVLQLLHDVNDT